MFNFHEQNGIFYTLGKSTRFTTNMSGNADCPNFISTESVSKVRTCMDNDQESIIVLYGKLSLIQLAHDVCTNAIDISTYHFMT